MKQYQVKDPSSIISYFKADWPTLLIVTVSGVIYNIGLLAGPWFEGRMAQRLLDIFQRRKTFRSMAVLTAGYVLAIAAVQTARFVKRLYVRKFCNHTNRSMKEILYAGLVDLSAADLAKEDTGNMITKAISDVDDCAEGMRKFTTEIFDTGIALIGYVCMLLYYDFRLALLCLVFPPVSYFIAEKMKVVVQKAQSRFKTTSARLSSATLDRVSAALTYRVFGVEPLRDKAYEACLDDYERDAAAAGVFVSAMPPLYQIISMFSSVLILYFGSRNVLGKGYAVWDIAAFTTFISCYAKLSLKSSKAAKLFNSVQKAQVSWRRIRPLMQRAARQNAAAGVATADGTLAPAAESGSAAPENATADCPAGDVADCSANDAGCSGNGPAGGAPSEHSANGGAAAGARLRVRGLSFSYDKGSEIFKGISFDAQAGEMIGVTGPVACGKSTFGKVFLCEHPYEGSVQVNGQELSSLPRAVRSTLFGYLGHDPELLNDTIENNVLMGQSGSVWPWLRAVCLDQEVMAMQQKEKTIVGSTGVRLSGGQAQRLALARTLARRRPVYILDDPFSALDKETEQEIFRNIQTLCRSSIVILISHRLYCFDRTAKVIWLSGDAARGNSVRIETNSALRRECEEYNRLWRLQEGETVHEQQ